MIIGLHGPAQSGKDTVGQILVDHHGFERRAFADKLRHVALGADPYVETFHFHNRYERLSDVVRDIGWDKAKLLPDVRRFLQRLGTEGVRDNLGTDTWVDAATSDIGDNDSATSYVFTDVRFQNEIDTIHALGGEVWKVVRPGVGPLNAHASEQPLTGIGLEILNDGSLEQLALNVDRALGGR